MGGGALKMTNSNTWFGKKKRLEVEEQGLRFKGSAMYPRKEEDSWGRGSIFGDRTTRD